MDQPNVNVITTGALCAGTTEDDAATAMARLFKIPPERAAGYIGQRRTIKSNLSASKAEQYKQKIEALGLVVELEDTAAKTFELALEPIADASEAPQPKSEPVEAQPKAQTHAPDPKRMTCPKCQLEQDKAIECQGCGVIIEKALAAQTINAEPAPSQKPSRLSATQDDTKETEVYDEVTAEGLPMLALGAAAGTALLGAFLWKFIAVTFSYELGIIAWGLGGAIGFAAAAAGARGLASGVACALLALLAIFGGKYLTVQSFQNNLAAFLTQSIPEEALAEAYAEELDAAKVYLETVITDEDRRVYMVDYYYSESEYPEEISDEELAVFKNETEPYLLNLANNPPGYEGWLNQNIDLYAEDISTWALMKEDLGALDFLFLFLGMGTAFRLGRGAET